MLTLDQLLARRDALMKARLGGVSSISIPAAGGGSRSITYKTDAEMAAALASIDREIAALSGKRPADIVFKTSKGC